MQQYYETDTPHTLTVFHTREGNVSFDIEHFGTAVLEDTDKLIQLFERGTDRIEFSGREIRGRESSSTCVLTRRDDGADVFISGTSYGSQREIEVNITESQLEKLVNSIGSADESVGYDVESVER